MTFDPVASADHNDNCIRFFNKICWKNVFSCILGHWMIQCILFLSSGGFLISPKWKNFRSQKLQFAEKTRLNNAIWRCWHIQCELYLK